MRQDQRSAATAPAADPSQLPDSVRGRMDAAFGADFSSVRVHEGSQAGALGALAYTQGQDLHFGAGGYAADAAGGQLLGHELAHVVQQREGRVPASAQGAPSGAPFAHYAD